MKKYALLSLCLAVLLTAGISRAEEKFFSYRFADADEAAELLLSNRAYYENLSQNDLNFRLQKHNGTLKELETLTAKQTLDFTDEEKAAIDSAMEKIEEACEKHGYTLPAEDSIIFAKTTMQEECNAAAYTHGTQIYLGEQILRYGLIDDPAEKLYFQEVISHELFHCLTRSHPEFRKDMYGILGFTVVEEDYDFPQAVSDVIISNPDVEHHNSYASFEIGGEMKDCTVIFTTDHPFEQPGDNFFTGMMTGLVPVDDLSVIYTSDDAANFWDVFGRNTNYVIDPEETLADNFSFIMTYGPAGYNGAAYNTPELIESIDAYLKH